MEAEMKQRDRDRTAIIGSLLSDREFLVKKIANMNVEYTGFDKALKTHKDEIEKIDNILSESGLPLVEVIDIKPTENQVVIIRFKEHLTDKALDRISDLVKEKMPEWKRVLVFEGDVSMAIANIPAAEAVQ